MQIKEYRDMYFAISNGVELGISQESIIEEVVAERRTGIMSKSDYNKLLNFFTECDKRTGISLVERSRAVIVQRERDADEELYSHSISNKTVNLRRGNKEFKPKDIAFTNSLTWKQIETKREK